MKSSLIGAGRIGEEAPERKRPGGSVLEEASERKQRRSASPASTDQENENSVGMAVQIWKKDPSVKKIGIRRVFLPFRVLDGPKDERISIEDLKKVSRDENGDMLVREKDTEAFDAVHTFAVARMTLTMYQRALEQRNQPAELPFVWNIGGVNKEPIQIYPHGLKEKKDAFYIRQNKAITFGYFAVVRTGKNKSGRKIGKKASAQQFKKVKQEATHYTCRAFDVVAHEMGHAILDGLQPGWMTVTRPSQTGALHEAFGDLTAMFLLLDQLDLVEFLIAETKADLYGPNFCNQLAKQFGQDALHTECLRNAYNMVKLSKFGQIPDKKVNVHDLSQVFTGAIYYILADLFKAKRRPKFVDDAVTLYKTAACLRGLLLLAIKAAPPDNATFRDVGLAMIDAATSTNNGDEVVLFIKKRFAEREIDLEDKAPAEPARTNPLHRLRLTGNSSACSSQESTSLDMRNEDGAQNRNGCCATMRMQVEEYVKLSQQSQETD